MFMIKYYALTQNNRKKVVGLIQSDIDCGTQSIGKYKLYDTSAEWVITLPSYDEKIAEKLQIDKETFELILRKFVIDPNAIFNKRELNFKKNKVWRCHMKYSCFDDFNELYQQYIEYLNTDEGKEDFNKRMSEFFKDFVDFKDVAVGDNVLSDIKCGKGIQKLDDYEEGITWENPFGNLHPAEIPTAWQNVIGRRRKK